MKIYDAIIGFVVGDALGVPYEFCERDTFKAEGMTGYGTHNQPAGTWSDDSSMTLATLDSLVCCGEIKLDDVMERFADWLRTGRYTAHWRVFDVGTTTHSAINRYRRGIPPQNCGSADEQSNGNGALMRILPLAFVPHSINDIHAVAGLTHAHEISQICCEVYLGIAGGLLSGQRKEAAVAEVCYDIPKYLERLCWLGSLSRDEIRSSGYVVDTLEAALWCLLKTDNYRDCVLMAVNLGGDTDTIAALAGGLAGILYGVGGENGITEEWISQIAKHEEIEALCRAFDAAFRRS